MIGWLRPRRQRKQAGVVNGLLGAAVSARLGSKDGPAR